MLISDAARALERDLRGIFGSRLQSLVVYGQRGAGNRPNHAAASHGAHGAAPPTRTLAVVASMTHEDLRASAARVDAWHGDGLATPLLIAAHEFERSLDAFPLEFGAILADHIVVSGENPFAALAVDPSDIRRACEVQARSHLLHLREGFLEARGRPDAVSLLIVESAPAFASLVASLARLDNQPTDEPGAAARYIERAIDLTAGPIAEVASLAGAHDLPSADADRLFAPYLDAVERLVVYVDGWSAR